MNGKKKTYRDYKTLMQITEIEKGKYLVVGVVNKAQMTQLFKMFEPLSREWRGQYQALAKSIVKAYQKRG